MDGAGGQRLINGQGDRPKVLAADRMSPGADVLTCANARHAGSERMAQVYRPAKTGTESSLTVDVRSGATTMPMMRRLTVLAGVAEAARRYARNHPDKINRLADKAGHFVDQSTKGRYHGKINKAVRKVRSTTAHSASRRG